MIDVLLMGLGFLVGAIAPTWRLKGDRSWLEMIKRLVRGNAG